MPVDQTMYDFDQMQYQTQAAEELKYFIQTKRIPNALLFSGTESTGKKQAAFLFAKGCNCLENQPFGCSGCESCIKIDADSHPDILTIDLEKNKKAITISQVREVASRICSRPNEARHRMVLILNADGMNPQAQNAMLKILEEPPEGTFFILNAVKDWLLLPTIRSRCRKIRFKPLTETFIEQVLQDKWGVDPLTCQIASRTSGADLEKAKMYCGIGEDPQKTNWPERRKQLLSGLVSIITAKNAVSISKGLMLSFNLSVNPESLSDSMAVIRTFFRDLAVKNFHPKKIVNLDFSDAFDDINQKISRNYFLKWLEDIIETEKRMASNSSPRLALDRFFLGISADKGNMTR